MQGWDGAAYDRWLEAPYVEAAQREAAFEAWCEANDVDPNDDNAWDDYERALEDYEPDYERDDDWNDDGRDEW